MQSQRNFVWSGVGSLPTLEPARHLLGLSRGTRKGRPIAVTRSWAWMLRSQPAFRTFAATAEYQIRRTFGPRGGADVRIQMDQVERNAA